MPSGSANTGLPTTWGLTFRTSSTGVPSGRAVDGWDNFAAKGPIERTRFGYTGAEWDGETGLYHMGARYYDPTLGRFIQQDPADEGLNPYRYGWNDPVNYSDPTGMTAFRTVGSAAGAGAIGVTSSDGSSGGQSNSSVSINYKTTLNDYLSIAGTPSRQAYIDADIARWQSNPNSSITATGVKSVDNAIHAMAYELMGVKQSLFDVDGLNAVIDEHLASVEANPRAWLASGTSFAHSMIAFSHSAATQRYNSDLMSAYGLAISAEHHAATFSNQVGSFVSGLGSKASGLLNSIGGAGSNWFSNAFNTVSNVVSKGKDMWSNFTGGIGSKVSSFFSSNGSSLIGNLAKSFGGNVGNWLTQNGSNLVGKFSDMMGNRAVNWLNNTASNVLSRITNNPLAQRIGSFFNSGYGQMLLEFFKGKQV